MKKEIEKKDSEYDENVDRLTSKHSHELGEAKYKACLLYTSDAADES